MGNKFQSLNSFSLCMSTGSYLFNTRTRYEICSKLAIKIQERRQWRRSGVFIVNFEDISDLFLVILLLT